MNLGGSSHGDCVGNRARAEWSYNAETVACWWPSSSIFMLFSSFPGQLSLHTYFFSVFSQGALFLSHLKLTYILELSWHFTFPVYLAFKQRWQLQSNAQHRGVYPTTWDSVPSPPIAGQYPSFQSLSYLPVKSGQLKLLPKLNEA